MMMMNDSTRYLTMENRSLSLQVLVASKQIVHLSPYSAQQSCLLFILNARNKQDVRCDTCVYFLQSRMEISDDEFAISPR
jgi:hypothetical protein